MFKSPSASGNKGLFGIASTFKFFFWSWWSRSSLALENCGVRAIGIQMNYFVSIS
jgi:hypothetical protein